MNTQLFIENYPADMSEDISSLITYEIDNIREFARRATKWSKTIVLPGTARNNKLFGHIFNIGQSNAHNAGIANINYNFNVSKYAKCILFNNHMQTLRGVMRILQINIDKGRVEYEISISGELVLLNTVLKEHFLDELDFSAYDTTWGVSNIIASWDNVGSGVMFPLIDYGQCSVSKKHWDIRAFRPAFFAKEYIDKIFEQHGFTYSSDLFNTTRFKKLIIPYNKKEVLTITDYILDVSRSSSEVITADGNVHWNVLTTTGAFTVGVGNSAFTFVGSGTPVTGDLTLRVAGRYYSTTNSLFVEVRKNGQQFFNRELQPSATYSSFQVDINLFNGLLAVGDVLTVAVRGTGGTWSFEPGSGSRLTYVTDQPVVVPVTPGGTIKMNSAIPRNIRQLDFIMGIVHLFNLYVYEDTHDSRLIYFKPYVDFYSTSPLDAVDWTYKLNRDAVIKIKPMSELNAKTYSFRYKEDADYWNQLYKGRYRNGYGDHIFDSEFEFAEQNEEIMLPFSATVLTGREGEDKIVSAIYKMGQVDAEGRGVEESYDSNIRILQTKKILEVAEYKILDGSEYDGAVLTTLDLYGYAGHYDDPDAPANDINFGVTRELFFTLAAGDPSRTQFNVYWSAYLAEITDKDSKLLIGKFYLTPKDIMLIDFSKKVHVDGVLYRLNAIRDYNASVVAECEVELLKVNYLIY